MSTLIEYACFSNEECLNSSCCTVQCTFQTMNRNSASVVWSKSNKPNKIFTKQPYKVQLSKHPFHPHCVSVTGTFSSFFIHNQSKTIRSDVLKYAQEEQILSSISMPWKLQILFTVKFMLCRNLHVANKWKPQISGFKFLVAWTGLHISSLSMNLENKWNTTCLHIAICSPRHHIDLLRRITKFPPHKFASWEGNANMCLASCHYVKAQVQVVWIRLPIRTCIKPPPRATVNLRNGNVVLKVIWQSKNHSRKHKPWVWKSYSSHTQYLPYCILQIFRTSSK
jgi:hypothetical protein